MASFLNQYDYLFGTDDSARYLMRSHQDWSSGFATALHLFFMLILGLVVANLLIAIVGNCWEQSCKDHPMWRHFGRAAFSYQLRKKRAEGSTGRCYHCVGMHPRCCGLLPRDGEPRRGEKSGSSGRWSTVDGSHEEVSPFSPAMLVTLKPIVEDPVKCVETRLTEPKEMVDELNKGSPRTRTPLRTRPSKK